MLIDWFTVIAQVINFLVLAWLLKRFLYHPILNAIDAREKRIAAELADADAKRAEAEKQHEEFQHKNEEFDNQKTARLNQVTEDVKKERVRLLDEVREESEALRSKLQSALKSEQLSFKEALSLRAVKEVFAIARKVLSDLAGITLEERMVELFIDRLRELDNEEVADLESAFQELTQPLLVRTAFTLPQEQHVLIAAAIKELLGKECQVQFATEPDLVSGIELAANGQKIAWSIADYLDSLAKSVDQLLQELGNSQVEAVGIDSATTVQGGHEAST